MSYEQLKDTLISKIEHELFDYKQNLIRNCTPEKIIEQAYETMIKDYICDIILYKQFDKNEVKALLKTDNILSKLYDKYLHSECNLLDVLKDNVDDSIRDITKEYEKRKMQEKAR